MLGSKVGEEAERCNVNLHKNEFSLFVGGVADDGGWVSSQVMMNHRVKKVLQSSGPWSDHTQGCDGFGLDELKDNSPKVFVKGKYLSRCSREFRVLGKQFGEEGRRVHLSNKVLRNIMMGKSMSYVMCEVNMMTGFFTHMVINKFTHSPDPSPRWKTNFS
jgi:hypothetical protein